MSFFRLLLAAFFGTILASIVGFFLLLFIVGGLISSATAEKAVSVPEKTILEFNLAQAFAERSVEDPLLELLAENSGEAVPVGVHALTRALKAAQTDDRVIGLYLTNATPQAAPATLQELRRAIESFKASGKFVYAYSEYYSEAGLHLTALADSVFVYPTGGLEWDGLASTPMYYKGALDKLGIETEVIKVGSFKSAAEPFVEKRMSAANREQLTVLLADLWATITAPIATDRGIEPQTLTDLANGIALHDSSATDTMVALKLASGIRYEDQVLKLLAAKQGKGEKNEPETLSLSQYAKVKSGKKYSDSRIAIIYAEGEITMGGGEEFVTPDRMAKALRKAREDKRVKAVVLRVNSPGGSALASDMIWREVKLTAEAKPVIASFGDYAASGGYYIGVAADYIVAEAATITGSIGVVGLHINVGGMLENKLGITTERVTTNASSDFFSPYRSMTPTERSRAQNATNEVYRDFVSRVVEGREAYTTFEEVDKIGQGRVWSGTRALELKLVDELGGLGRAIALAAERGGAGDDYQLVEYPELKGPLQELLDSGTRAQLNLGQRLLSAPERELRRLVNSLDDPRGVYVRDFTVPELN